ncbi:phosphatase PAP2 family protein [Lysobacter sp. K5869]|uniref:phosphatase PAP2 family protein n=1 Tax=Lysobacter sp. K5869 TaxID=2820808 RepID=UPI001C064028|nr:phosphatase PAP2 family protein [Lysobacter sp. K5869]QWP77243.1 phosphatase PAP2 family protein [Lysobacter sp. K5869]
MNRSASTPLAPAALRPAALPAVLPGVAAGVSARRFVLRHALWPLLAVLALSTLSMGLGGDFWLADRWYALQGGRWALENAYLTEHVIHRFGRDASTAAWLGAFAFWVFARSRPALADWRRPLAYLLLATLLSVSLVSGLKSLTNMDCPWDLARYGGDLPFYGLFASRPAGLDRGVCFPAGHASGGYAWVALYFFFLQVRPRLRWTGLAIGLGVGLVFGISQQLRGAHFLSHDVWTLAISWFVALTLYLAMARREAPRAQPAAASALEGAGR